VAGSRQSVTVVGAGLAGSVLAAQLGQRGIEVDVYERRPDPRVTGAERGRSINLALSSRGLAAITQLGLRQEVLARALPMRGRTVHPVRGNTAYQPYSAEGTRAINSISRSELNAILLDCAEKSPGVRIHFKHRVTGVDPEEGELTLATPEGTKNATSDVILASDGAYSAVRASLQFREGFSYSQDFLDHGYKELTIAAGPDGRHQLDPATLHVWPRGDSMMIALPNLDGSYTCTLFWPKSGRGGLDSLRTPPEIISFFEQHYPDAVSLMPDLIEDYRANPVGSLVTVRCRPWVSGRVALVGDAAHAIVPFYGQGANAAMEDCVELVRCFDEARGDWPATLAEYQEQRKPNTDAIADYALQNFVEMRDSVGSSVFRAKTALRHALERASGGRYTSRYELVSFSTVPYADIAPMLQRQDRVLAAGVLAGVGVVLLSVLSRRRILVRHGGQCDA
jgi:kynurenine 3-monooxygenase